jgi:hypothetical protein
MLISPTLPTMKLAGCNALGGEPLALTNADVLTEQLRHLPLLVPSCRRLAPRTLMRAVIACHVVTLTQDHTGAYRFRSLSNSGIHGARDFTLTYRLNRFLVEVASSQYAMRISTRSLLIGSTFVPPNSFAPPLRTLCLKYR